MTKLIVMIGFVVAFAAGWMAGANWSPTLPAQSAEERKEGRSGRGSWLAEKLSLSAEQQKQLDEIWSEISRKGGREEMSKRYELRRERDAAIAALIRLEDMGAYDQVLKQYHEKTESLEGEWRATYQRAVERTKEILTPEQRAKYEEMLSRQGWEGGPRDRGRASATTRPATGPQD